MSSILKPFPQAAIIVESRADANGNIGASAVVKSDPNGETLLLGDLALAVNPSLVKAMPFDPVRDLEPVAMVGKAHVTSWWAVFAPAKVSAETVTRLQRATEKALQDPALQEQLARQNIEPTYADAKTLGKHLEDETRKWAAVIKNAKITAE